MSGHGAVPDATPVVVGAATVVHRPGEGHEPCSATDLMVAAAREALAGSTRGAVLGSRVGEVLVPHGTWPEPDPGRAVAAAVGSPRARSVRTELGVLQMSLLSRAAAAVADGRVEVAVVAGGEARWSQIAASRAGSPAPAAPAEAGGAPDETVEPAEMIISPVEIERNLTTAAHQYAIIESAVRHARGRSVDEHRAALGELWSAFARVAAGYDGAWDHRGLAADEIVTVTAANRLIAAPYPKWLVSQWNVDQAAALVLTTAGLARELGVPEDRWVFPLAFAESNLVVPLPERAELHRWPAFGVCARAAFDAAGVSPLEVGPVDLYSCFPAAVEVQLEESLLDVDPVVRPEPPTLTGGMTFGGGPFNNYVLQGAAAMVERIRRSEPGTVGLTSAVSGLLTKPAVALWSAAAPERPFAALDVSADAAGATARRPVDPDLVGDARIVGCTAVPEGEGLVAIAVVEAAAGVRGVALCQDPAVAVGVVEQDLVGAPVTLPAPGRFTLG